MRGRWWHRGIVLALVAGCAPAGGPAGMRDAGVAPDRFDAAEQVEAGCQPGETLPCACDGGAGATRCDDVGRWSACRCSSAMDAPDVVADVPADVAADRPLAPWLDAPPAGDGLPARLIRPQSASRATTQRPTFRWVPPTGVTRARLTQARDRALNASVLRGEVEGRQWRPDEALAFGVWFWRVEGLGADGGVAWTSPTWEFLAPRRDSAVDSSWGSLRDFNGDGYDDIALGVDALRAIEVLWGGPRGISAEVHSRLVHNAAGTPSYTSWSDDPEIYACDVNGDGAAEVATVQARRHPREGGVDYDHRLRVHRWEQASRAWSHEDLALPTETLSYHHRLTGCADWDGDGYQDLILTRSDDNREGIETPLNRVSVYRGSSRGIEHRATWSALIDFHLRPHWDRGIVGDVNRDGFPDQVMVGTPTATVRTNPTSATWGLVYGRGFPAGVVVATELGISGYNFLYPSFLGDVDGDGLEELLIGTSGSVRVHRPPIAPDAMPEPWLTLLSPDGPSGIANEAFGCETGVGDVNGDGLVDLLVGAPEAVLSEEGNRGRGRAYLYLGSREGLHTTPDRRWIGTDYGGGGTSRFGGQVDLGADLDGDGFSEVAVVALEQFMLVLRGASAPESISVMLLYEPNPGDTPLLGWVLAR